MPDPRFERARLARVRKALVSWVYFHEVYVRPFDPNATSAVPQHGVEMVAHALANDRSVCVLPPEYGKTTWISQSLPTWLTIVATVNGDLLRGMLLSEEEAMARGNLRFVAWHLTENDRIASDFADERGRPIMRKNAAEDVWRDDAIIVQRPGVSKDPTWAAKGLDSKGIHGRRLDWAIADDIITPASADSAAKRKQAEVKFDEELATRIVNGGHIAVVGNYLASNDLLHDLAAREGWSSIKRPSITLRGQRDTPAPEALIANEDATDLLWPEVWPRERLLREHRQRPNRFRKIHLFDPLAEGGEKLDPAWVTLVDAEDLDVGEATFYMAIDPAPGGETHDLDFFVVAVLARVPDGVVLVESYATRTPMGRQAALVGSIYDRWSRLGNGVSKVGISKVALDRYFRAALVSVRPDLDRLMEPLSTPGAKVERLESLGAAAMSGHLRVLRPVWTRQTSAHGDRHQELTLAREWTEFPLGAHDDRLDALDLALRAEESGRRGARRRVVVRSGA